MSQAQRRRRVAVLVALVSAASVLLPVVAPGLRRARADGPKHREAVPTVRSDSLRDFALEDLEGKTHRLADLRGAKAIVLAWTAAGCPVAMVYGPRLAAFARDVAPNGVVVLGVSSDDGADVAALRAFSKASGFDFPVLRDVDGALAERIGATTTTTIAVLDANRRIRYVGAFDDQYGVRGRKAAPEHAYARDALDAVLSAKAVPIERTPAPGCPITFASPAGRATGTRPNPGPTTEPAAPTWSGSVAKIVHARCDACHGEGLGAPFPLRTYEDVRSRVAVVKQVVTEGRMPPFGAAGPIGTYSNDRRLLPDEKAALLAWADAGGPAGDLAAAPPPPPLPEKDAWEIGPPDAILSFERAEEIPAEGVVPYRFIRVDTSYDEDRWVSAVEVKPGAPDVVHHVLVAAVPRGQNRVAGAFTPTNGFFAAMVPGGRAQTLPGGDGEAAPEGFDAGVPDALHARTASRRPTGRASGSGSPAPPTTEVRTVGIFEPRFSIPPGDANHVVTARVPVPFRARILAYMPHMHLRGTSFRYVLEQKGKPDETLLEVPKYDFNWQTPYRLATPRPVPMFSWIVCTATYDNSASNPYNPDPSATVHWGDQTWDEMMIGYLDFVIDR